MKKLLLITFLTIGFFSVKAQNNTLPYKDDKVVFEKIGELEGISKQDLYSGAKKWLADAFKSSKSVIQSENETTGQIIGKGNAEIYDRENTGFFINYMKLYFSIQIDCKDAKYRMRFYDLMKHTDASGQYVSETNTPIELLDKKEMSKKNLEKWNMLKVVLVKQLETYMIDFEKSLKKSSKDDF